MKICPNCGIQLNDEMAFCTNCGAAQAAPAPQAPQAPVYTAPQQPVYNQQPAYNQAPVYNQQPAYGQPVYGAPVQQQVPPASGLAKTALIFMIIGTIAMACCTYCIGLAWCLPMTISYSKKLKNGQPVSTGFKVWSLILVNTVAGILMLCDKSR